jgi:hypothetical protein
VTDGHGASISIPLSMLIASAELPRDIGHHWHYLANLGSSAVSPEVQSHQVAAEKACATSPTTSSLRPLSELGVKAAWIDGRACGAVAEPSGVCTSSDSNQATR